MLRLNCPVWVNDADPRIANIWRVVRDQPDALVDAIGREHPSVERFEALRAQLRGADLLGVPGAAAMIAVHQWSYSGLGLRAGGPIGGREQRGKYKIDCRWAPRRIKSAVFAASARLQRAKITSVDAIDMIRELTPEAVAYVDPPYFEMGSSLYSAQLDHVALRDALKSCAGKWLLSYDNAAAIRELYADFAIKTLSAAYAMSAKKTEELLITNAS